jgi:uncharacterized SAM-binding protein YcdF (DUF218 family)
MAALENCATLSSGLRISGSKINMRRFLLRILAALGVALTVLVASLGWRILSFQVTPAGTFDCGIILGAAVIDDRPSPIFQARIDHGIDLYQHGKVKALILTGGVGQDDTLAEGEVGAIYAEKKGVPAADLWVERQSKTTLENLAGAQVLMTEQGFHSALIVSDPLHLYRSVTIAQWLGMEVAPSATPYSRYKTWKTKFPFFLRELYFTLHFWASTFRA